MHCFQYVDKPSSTREKCQTKTIIGKKLNKITYGFCHNCGSKKMCMLNKSSHEQILIDGETRLMTSFIGGNRNRNRRDLKNSVSKGAHETNVQIC